MLPLKKTAAKRQLLLFGAKSLLVCRPHVLRPLILVSFGAAQRRLGTVTDGGLNGSSKHA